MATCAHCSRTFDDDRCPYCGSAPELVLHDSAVRETSPWWAQPSDFVGWKYRIAFFLFACLAVVWTAKKLGRTLSIVVGALALGVAVIAILLRYRDDRL